MGKKSPSTVCALPSRDIIIKTKFFVHINKICYQGRSAKEKTLLDRKEFRRLRLCKFKKGLMLKRDESHTNNLFSLQVLLIYMVQIILTAENVA